VYRQKKGSGWRVDRRTPQIEKIIPHENGSKGKIEPTKGGVPSMKVDEKEAKREGYKRKATESRGRKRAHKKTSEELLLVLGRGDRLMGKGGASQGGCL